MTRSLPELRQLGLSMQEIADRTGVSRREVFRALIHAKLINADAAGAFYHSLHTGDR